MAELVLLVFIFFLVSGGILAFIPYLLEIVLIFGGLIGIALGEDCRFLKILGIISLLAGLGVIVIKSLIL